MAAHTSADWMERVTGPPRRRFISRSTRKGSVGFRTRDRSQLGPLSSRALAKSTVTSTPRHRDPHEDADEDDFPNATANAARRLRAQHPREIARLGDSQLHIPALGLNR